MYVLYVNPNSLVVEGRGESDVCNLVSRWKQPNRNTILLCRTMARPLFPPRAKVKPASSLSQLIGSTLVICRKVLLGDTSNTSQVNSTYLTSCSICGRYRPTNTDRLCAKYRGLCGTSNLSLSPLSAFWLLLMRSRLTGFIHGKISPWMCC